MIHQNMVTFTMKCSCLYVTCDLSSDYVTWYKPKKASLGNPIMSHAHQAISEYLRCINQNPNISLLDIPDRSKAIWRTSSTFDRILTEKKMNWFIYFETITTFNK